MDRGLRFTLGFVGRRSRVLALLLVLSAICTPASAGTRHKPALMPRPLPPTVLPPPGSPPPAVYGFPPAAYRSGWYNTHYWPRVNNFHGFYGDHWQYGYFPGY